MQYFYPCNLLQFAMNNLQWFLETPEAEYSNNEFLETPEAEYSNNEFLRGFQTTKNCSAMLCKGCAAGIDKKSCIEGVNIKF